MDSLSDILSHGITHQLLDHLPDGVYVVDRDCRIAYWNVAVEALSGYTVEQVVGEWCQQAFPPHIDCHGTPCCGDHCPVRSTMAEGVARRERVFMQHRAGHRVAVNLHAAPLRDESSAIVGAMCIITDRPMEPAGGMPILPGHAASVDPITRLANNACLLRSIEGRLTDIVLDGDVAAAIFIEVDNFNSIPSADRRATGDHILRTLGRTIQTCCREGEVVGRWEECTFIALLHHDAHKRMANVAEQMRVLIEHTPVNLGPEKVRVSIATAYTAMTANDKAADVIERGMSMLAQAVAQGGNCVVGDCDLAAASD